MYRVDTYVRVNGRINSFGNRISIVCHTMNPITDFNEITYHLLDTIETHLRFAKPGSVSIYKKSFFLISCELLNKKVKIGFCYGY